MSEYLSFDGLLAIPAASTVEDDLELPGWGKVRVRGLSTEEYWKAQASARETGKFDDERWQALIVAGGMVQPKLSYDEAVKFTRTRAYGVVSLLVSGIFALTMGVPAGVITQEAVDKAEATFRDESSEASGVPTG